MSQLIDQEYLPDGDPDGLAPTLGLDDFLLEFVEPLCGFFHSSSNPPETGALCSVELCLRLLATWTTPVIGQVLESHAIVFCRVIDVAADGAHILTTGFLI